MDLKQKIMSVIFFVTVLPIPAGGDKTFWELMFDPFTRYIYNYFYLSIVMIIAMMIWYRVDDVGPVIIWISFSSGVLTMFLNTGQGTLLFGIVTVLTLTVGGVRLIVRRF